MTYPSEAYAWRVATLLMVAGMFSYIDRQVLAVMTEYLRRDFVISDTQIGILLGFPFAIFFTLAGLPLGRLVDLYDRLVILAVGVALWSLCTFASAFATDFPQLLTMRIGVAVGEATLSTMTYALLADCFPKTKMGFPITTFIAANYFGAALAFIGGGQAVTALARFHRVALPFGVTVFGWQLSFVIVGAPGLLIAAAALLFKDPARPRPWARHKVGAVVPPPAPALSEAFAYFAAHWRAFMAMILGITLLTAVIFGALAWAPAFLQRTFGWSAARSGLAFGLIYASFSIVGTLISGWLNDQVAKRRGPAGRLVIAIAAPLIVLVFGFYPLAPTPALSLAMLGVLFFGLALANAVGPIGVQNICPPAFRGQATAIYALTLNLVGAGLGPLVIALITDNLFHDRSMVRYSICIATLVIMPLAVLVLWSGRKAVAAAIVAADSWRPSAPVAVNPVV